jgi:hypothetical protein
MPYGYTGQNLINQTVKNSGVFSISDVADLEKQGKFGGSLELIEEQTISTDVPRGPPDILLECPILVSFSLKLLKH